MNYDVNSTVANLITQGKESPLEELLRQGAQRILSAALEHEINETLKDFNKSGETAIVRNGYHRQRTIATGLGPVTVKAPRLRDKDGKRTYSSAILPKYMRRVPSIDNLVPALYLKGISTQDFPEALSAILGEQVSGLSATNIVRLKQIWEQEYAEWDKRDLSDKQYVYVWVDGIYFNVRLDDERQCILVVMGATTEGKKELLAVKDGYRESTQSWRELLLQLKRQGLSTAPHLAIGDGALGFWKALSELFPSTRHQRCWVHKTANILDKMPKSVQGNAKSLIHDMYMAETENDALDAYEHFLNLYEAKYAGACNCLKKDKDDLFAFYDFPAEHWIHLRTTNPIESTFATVRLRTKRTKGCGSRIATLTMVWKLVKEAEMRWFRLRKRELITLVIAGKKFKDGMLQAA